MKINKLAYKRKYVLCSLTSNDLIILK